MATWIAGRRVPRTTVRPEKMTLMNPGFRIPRFDPSLDPDEYVFSHSLRVRFAETDAMGIVHHSRYLPYLEEARVEYMRSIGQSYAENRAAKRDFAVLECGLRYRSPLRFDDVVEVHLRPHSATGATFAIDYLLTVGTAITTTARTVHAYVDSDGRPHRLPTWIKDVSRSTT